MDLILVGAALGLALIALDLLTAPKYSSGNPPLAANRR
jgi:hypothetical protein